MTNVKPLADRYVDPLVQAAALSTPPTNQAAVIHRQEAIENALSMALYWIRHQEHPNAIHAATVRAVRAASMLKQACREVGNGGRAGR